MPLQQVAVFNPFPFVLGQRIHIAGGPRGGDWQVIGLSERKVQLRCPVSAREVEWDRFCYLTEAREQEWPMPYATPITTILFDYGGVLAEEGFTLGLSVIARENGLDPADFFHIATEAIYSCGYVTGTGSEHEYWQLLRRQTGIRGDDQTLTETILSRFTLRPKMLTAVHTLKKQGLNPVILSDQTDWLDHLNQRQPFFHEFSQVFNSYHLGKTKRDPRLFTDILSILGVEPRQALFVDDNPGHIERATALGLETHLFQNEELFFADLARRGLG